MKGYTKISIPSMHGPWLQESFCYFRNVEIDGQWFQEVRSSKCQCEFFVPGYIEPAEYQKKINHLYGKR